MSNNCYNYSNLFFKKRWCWFKKPYDVENLDIINFFSYQNVDVKGFKKKKGLTTVINLNTDLENIWQGFRKKFIKKQIKRGERNNIKIVRDIDFKKFISIYKYFRQKKSLSSVDWRLFKNNGINFSAYFSNQMIAAGVFIGNGKFLRAWVLVSKRLEKNNSQLNEIIGQANRMIIWEAIKYAKENNYQLFDLGGINPNSKLKSELTLMEFKEAFGGYRLECFYYHKIYSPILKFLIRLKAIIRL